MKISLKKKIFLYFITVIIMTGFLISYVGIKFIGKSIAPRIQDNVRLELNSAREIYKESLEKVQNVIRLTSIRFFIKDGMLDGDINGLTEKLEEIRQNESLDILNLTDPEGRMLLRAKNPKEKADNKALKEIIRKVLTDKNAIVSTEILSKDELLKEGEELANQSYIRIIPSQHMRSTDRAEETSGMFIMAAAPVLSDTKEILGVLYGGKLINRNYSLTDEIRDTIFKREKYNGKDVGIVTIFLGNIRISTNIKTEIGDRAVGTMVSEDVSKHVLSEGNTWLDRTYVMDDWYIEAYEPINNTSSEIVGILGLGLLESKYKDMQKHASWIFFGIIFGGIILSIIICYFLTDTIMRPINSLLIATQNLAKGNLEQHVQLKNAPEEIFVLGKAFNYMVSSIKERDMQLRQRAQEEIMKSERLAMIGQLAAGVAHEINNPLGGIILFSRLLLQKAPPDGLMRDNLERIEKEAKRCQNIVQGLLDFARQREPKIETLHLNDLIEKTVDLFEKQPLFLNIEIIKEFQSDLPQILADSSQIQQVFVNIIMNAVDAMEGKGELIIGTISAINNDYVEVSFTDTGCGIKPDQLERIFEPFFTTKGVGHGTGLGLSISYGIIQRHGGTIQVTSRVGEGSTFVVILPKSKGQN